jgi:hypothetical protein
MVGPVIFVQRGSSSFCQLMSTDHVAVTAG